MYAHPTHWRCQLPTCMYIQIVHAYLHKIAKDEIRYWWSEHYNESHIPRVVQSQNKVYRLIEALEDTAFEAVLQITSPLRPKE